MPYDCRESEDDFGSNHAEKQAARAAETAARYRGLLDRTADLEASRARLLAALNAMLNTHGMHGPCKNHNCQECRWAVEQARAAIAEAEMKP